MPYVFQFALCILASFIFFVQSGLCALPSQISGIDLVHGGKVKMELSKPRLGTVIVFLSSKCPCSASHQPALNELAQEFEKDGFRFVGVNANTNEEFELS